MAVQDPQGRGEIVRVSISEAARLFGVSQQSIRRAIKNEEITYIVVAERYKINFESLVRWSQEKTHRKNRLEQAGIGQFVSKWKIRNKLYSPNLKSTKKQDNPDEKSKLS